jgi:transcriptional regulator with XRE-family HTH domain
MVFHIRIVPSSDPEIALKIKDARKERNFTQKQLALGLHKTTVSISEMERGNVKIPASELSIIAEILNKPIEYFYGVEIGSEEIQDMVSILRKTSPELREETLRTIKLTMSMQQAADVFSIDPNHNMSSEEAKRFVIAFMDYKSYINDLVGTLNGMETMLKQVLKDQGIELPSKPQ